MFICTCSIPNGFLYRAISLYSSKTVDKKEILRTVYNLFNLLFMWQNWYSLTSVIHFWKFHRQHQWTLQLVWGHGVLHVCTVHCVQCTVLYITNLMQWEWIHSSMLGRITYVGVLISLWLFLFPICSITKIIFLRWIKEVRTTKS
jgi:hypothetical protein